MRNESVRHSKPHPPGKLFTVIPCSAVCLLVVLSGCGESGPAREAVAGRVVVDGEPLELGSIVFEPTEANPGPRAGGRIEQGRFEIPRSKGPVVGEHRVEIRADQDLGYDITDPEEFAPHAGEPLPDNTVPKKYNENTVLRKKVTASGPNEFDFELHTSLDP